MIEKNVLGKFIREKRELAGLSQKQLAEQLFVTESAVSKWERGVNYPDITLISELCQVLNVSEKELITASDDSAYRKIKKQSVKYERIKKLFFWVPTSAYLLAFLICIICCLSGVLPIGSFMIVAASLVCAFLFVPSICDFVKDKKLAWYAVSSMFGIAVLLTVCGLVTHSAYWVPTAICGTALGYAIVFLPIILNRYTKNKFVGNHKALICFAADAALTAILVLTVNFITKISTGRAELLVLYAATPFVISGFIISSKLNKLIKAGICTVVFGSFLCMTNYAVSGIMKTETNMRVDFNDWVNYINGNVFTIIFAACLAVSAVLLYFGIRNRKSS